MNANNSFFKVIAALLALSFVVPVRAAGYERYRRVITPNAPDRFYKNIPVNDLFRTPATVSPYGGPGGGVLVRTADAVAIGSKGVITATATGVTSAVEILGVAKAMAGGPYGIAIFAVPLIAEWLLSRDTRPAPSGSSLPFEVLKESAGCTSAGCKEYSHDGQLWTSHVGACNEKFKGYAGNQYNQNGGPSEPDSCKVIFQYPGNNPVVDNYPLEVRTIPVSNAASWQPAGYPDVENKIKDKPVPPGVVEELAGKGGVIPISYAPGSGYVPIDGPASLDSPATVVTSTSGDITTNTYSQDKTGLKYDLLPDPATGKATPTVTATTVNNSTSTTTNNSTGGSTTTNTTSVTNNGTTTTTNNTTGVTTTTNNTTGAVTATTTPDKPPEAPATDTPLPEQPKLYKQKYPEGITGVWQKNRDLMANSPLFTIAKTLMPAVGMGGSCPTMPVNLNFSQWANFGTRDVAPPCVVWDWGKAICIVSACLLARRLIFGG